MYKEGLFNTGLYDISSPNTIDKYINNTKVFKIIPIDSRKYVRWTCLCFDFSILVLVTKLIIPPPPRLLDSDNQPIDDLNTMLQQNTLRT